jgi:hypothetical protein
MQITFQGHASADRSVIIDEADLAILNDLLRQQFLEHVQYGIFTNAYVSSTDKKLLELCSSYGVDGAYTPDRLAFFKALLGVVND